MCLSLSVQLPQICRFYFAFRGPQGTASRSLRTGQRHRRVVVATHGDGDDSTMAAADPRVDLKLNARNAEKERKRESQGGDYIRAPIKAKNALLHGRVNRGNAVMYLQICATEIAFSLPLTSAVGECTVRGLH